MRLRTIIALSLVAGLAGTCVGVALAEQRGDGSPRVMTAADCPDAASLYEVVGIDVQGFGSSCPTRDAVLSELANSEPSSDLAELCRQSIGQGRAVGVCEEFLDNRQHYLDGAAELRSQGTDLGDYKGGQS